MFTPKFKPSTPADAAIIGGLCKAILGMSDAQGQLVEAIKLAKDYMPEEAKPFVIPILESAARIKAAMLTVVEGIEL